MSESISVMVGHGCTLEQAAERVGYAIGQPLEFLINEWGPRFVKDTMGIDITAYSDHGLVDDSGIEFSAYPIEIQFNREGGTDAELRNELCRVLALRSASLIYSKYKCKCLVVHEAAHVVESFGR